MTPLAMRVARELTLPIKRRTFNHPGVLERIEQDIHCFDISAIAGPINDAMMAANVWPDVATMLPDLFLPSPVTWLEFTLEGKRLAYVLSRREALFHMDVVHGDEPPFGITFGDFRACSILQSPDRIDLRLADADEMVPKDNRPKAITSVGALSGADYRSAFDVERQVAAGEIKAGDPYLSEKIAAMSRQVPLMDLKLQGKRRDLRDAEATKELIGAANHVIAFSVLAIDLINTPGVVGFKQHAPHAGLAKQFARSGIGSYPLRAWSEVTVKTHTRFDGGEYESGATFRKCLHFVRAHRRRYSDGTETVVRAHWRGDPALGIKRTRYRVAA